jgi:hypothetical protein
LSVCFLYRSYLSGDIKYTNHIKDLLSAYRKGTIPKHWKALYVVYDSMTFNQWIEDFFSRLQFLSSVLSSSSSVSSSSSTMNDLMKLFGSSFSSIEYQLSKMKYSDGILMAARQQMAKLHSWSLEEMELFLDIGTSSSSSANNTLMFGDSPYDLRASGLIIQGAKYDSVKHCIVFSEELNEALPTSFFKWRLKSSIVRKENENGYDQITNASSSDSNTSHSVIQLPIYYTDNRKHLMHALYVTVSPASGGGQVIPSYQWAQRSVAIVLQTSLQ